MKACPHCVARVSDSAVVCPVCNRRVDEPIVVTVADVREARGPHAQHVIITDIRLPFMTFVKLTIQITLGVVVASFVAVGLLFALAAGTGLIAWLLSWLP